MKKLSSPPPSIHPSFIFDIIAEQAQKTPNKVALEYQNKTQTFSELDSLIDKTAGYLYELGVRKGDRIAWLATNIDLFWPFFFAASKIGAVIAPLNWRLAPAELSQIIDDMQSPTLFAEPDFLSPINDLANASCKTTIGINQELYTLIFQNEKLSVKVVTKPDDVVLQLYTSGTTGVPKGVLLTHYCFQTVAHSQFSIGAISSRFENEVTLHVLPHFHIAGVTLGLLAWKQALTLHQHRDFNVPAVLTQMTRGHPINMFLVPSMIEMLIEGAVNQNVSLGSVACISYGAAPMPQRLLHKALKAMPNASFYQFYGMTETTGGLSVLGAQDHKTGSAKLKSAGQPLPHCEVKIVCPNSEDELPVGQVGEIITRSEHIMTGYWNRQEATEQVISHGFYKTGDAGFIDQDGYLFVVDRIKDMVISGGENIYPAELENVLAKHDSVLECAFFGVPDKKWGEVLNGLVVTHPGETLSEGEVMDYLATKVAKFKLPRRINFADTLPRNAAGKVSKHNLRKQFSG